MIVLQACIYLCERAGLFLKPTSGVKLNSSMLVFAFIFKVLYLTSMSIVVISTTHEATSVLKKTFIYKLVIAGL